MLCATAFAGWTEPCSALPITSTLLFTIVRSKNANVVRYVARTTRQSALDLRRPIDAHWLMLAEDGRREELSWAERRLAYGFSVSNVSAGGCALALVACESRPIRAERAGNGFRALLSIRGQRSILKRIFVQTTEAGLLPSVAYLELFGTTLDGAPLSERIEVG